jgi:hypothetical protein
MYLEFVKNKHKDAVSFLIDKMGHKEGSDRFILAVRDGLGMSGQRLVWWVNTFDKYHKHENYTYNNILKTRRHFKNIAFTYLDSGDYKMFESWIKNWSNTLIVCRHAYPDKWLAKNSEDTK